MVISRKEARARGLTRYFTGKPCKHGHVSERFSRNGVCVECMPESRRKWREANSSKVREGRRKWKQDNPERVNELAREWRAANSEKVRDVNRKYYRENRERISSQQRAFRQAHPDETRERNRVWYAKNARRARQCSSNWAKANKGKRAANQARRKAAKLRRTPEWADLDLIAAFYATAREMTEASGIPHEVDHVVPLQGKTVSGLHVAANLQILTKSENSSKGNKYEGERYVA